MAVPGSTKMRAPMLHCRIILLALAILVIGHGHAVPVITDYSELDNRYLSESTAIGTMIATIKASSDRVGSSLTFSMLENGGEYFNIGKEDGKVTLKKFLDAELETEIKFIIRVTDETGQYAERDGKVFVNDENDSDPEFTDYAIFRDVSESEPAGTVITGISVTDLDTKNAPITVICGETSPLFRDACQTFGLVKTENSNKYWRGNLVLKQRVDFEKRNSYNVLLIANDGVHNRTTEVHIEVVDVNDAPPTFVQTGPAEINEEIPIGSPIQTVRAVDGDQNNKRSIRYVLIGVNTDIFQINATTGVISSKVRLDFDARDFPKGIPYDVIIKAQEVINQTTGELGNDVQTTATTAIQVTVRDINDNSPTFSENTYIAYIDENIVSDANVPGLQMTVTDIDSGTFNSFDLLTLAHNDVFGIIPSNDAASSSATLFVKNGELIDYEKGPRSYIIPVRAIENMVTTGIHTGSATVTIYVRDVNDETPSFDATSYLRVISELAQPGYRIIDLNATDPEAGIFGTAGIRYKLFGNIPPHFEIEAETGVVKVAPCNLPGKPGLSPCIDYERKKNYTLTVSATDSNGVVPPGRTRSVQLIIRVEDANDNIPVIDDFYTRYIYEGERVTINPLLIQPIDPDTVGGPLTFSLTGETRGFWQIFEDGVINATKDIFYTDAPLDGIFNFGVVVRDQQYDTTANVRIIVIDINNNAPQFISNEFVTQIDEDTKGDVFVMKVTASDGDAPTTGNGIIDFSITSGAEGKFRLDNAVRDGSFFVADVYTTRDAVFNFDLKKEYQMRLVARDRGTPESKSGTALLTVKIRDVNNKDPVIYPSFNSVTVRETEPIGFSLYKVNAQDPDIESILKYSMTAAEATDGLGRIIPPGTFDYGSLFKINIDTGDVTVAAPLDRDNTSRVTYSLLVRDVKPTPEQRGTGTLMIYILEVNDQAPQFDDPHYEVIIDEELNMNAFVLSLNCIDKDDKISGYDLEQTFPRRREYFDLVPGSGSMIVSDRIDFETMDQDFIELTASCTDTGSPPMSNTTRVTVKVRNINDNSPVFDQPLYRTQIEENSVGGRLNVKISASDIDKGDFGVVRYMLDDSKGFFSIDPLTAEITILPNATFDREQGASFAFQVIAYDSPLNETVRRQTTVPVYITITDFNDNCPEFSKFKYTGTVPESASLDTDIIDILVTDKDEGINAEIVFAVDPNSGDPPVSTFLFGIGSTSGRVQVTGNLKNKEGVYRFNVTATDMKGQNPTLQCTTSVPVEVEVLQSDNEAPNWINPPNRDYSIYVLESQYEGMLVYRAKATDDNTGPSGVVDYYFTINGLELVDRTDEFKINRVTGVIRAEVVFDREQRDSYFLTLMARDRGNPAASSETTLTVIILDVDDNDPVFPMRNGVVEPLIPDPISENAKPGDTLAQCTATDADSDVENNRIFYRILQDDMESYVSIDPNNCKITLKKAVDYRNTPKLEFDVYAYNERNNDAVKREKREVNPSIQHVVINFVDDNSNPPQFRKSEYQACIHVDAPYRQSILEVEATDENVGGSGQLTYSLEGNDSSNFGIDTNLGVIYNAVTFPQVKNARIFNFFARASDGTVKSEPADITIFVITSDNIVKLKVDRPLTDVEPFQQAIIQTLVASSNGAISFACISSMKVHVDENGEKSEGATDVFIAAVKGNKGNYVVYGATPLADFVRNRSSDGKSPYDSIFVTQVKADSDDDSFILKEDAVLAILIITILLIFLAIFLFIIACICIRKAKKSKERKIQADRHTTVHMVPEPANTSFNAVYGDSDRPPQDEYAVIRKNQPINPVMVPAPQNLQPLQSEEPEDLQPVEPERSWQPEEPEPVIETEIVQDEPVHRLESPPPVRTYEPEFEDRIETEVVEPTERPPTPPEEQVVQIAVEEDDNESDIRSQSSAEPNVPEPVHIIEPEEDSIHSEPGSFGIPEPPPPAPEGDDDIEVIIQDSPNITPPPSPPRERATYDSD